MQIRTVNPVALLVALWLTPSGTAAQGGAEGRLPPPGVSDAFDHTVEYVEAGGVRVAYVSEGTGAPVVFVHGNPTSKYLWRNVIPHVSDRARAIALDLPGMGDSERPDPALGFAEQVRVFDAFIEALELDRVTLVLHDWGAAIGFELARRHPGKVRAVAVMEGVLPPVFPQSSFEAMGEEMGAMFRAFKDPVQGRELVIDQNIFIEQVLPSFINRTLTEAEMAEYRRPFADRADREAMLKWPREIPIAGEPRDVVESMSEIHSFMTTSEIPILLVHADPGVVVPLELVPWYEENVRNIQTAFVGQGLHFIQEDQPDAIGRAIRDWLRRNELDEER